MFYSGSHKILLQDHPRVEARIWTKRIILNAKTCWPLASVCPCGAPLLQQPRRRPQQPLPQQPPGAQELAALSLPPDVAAQRAAQQPPPGAEPPRGLQPVGFRSNPAAQAAAANPLATMGMMGSV